MRLIEVHRQAARVTDADLTKVIADQEAGGWSFAYMVHCPFGDLDRFMIAFRPASSRRAVDTSLPAPPTRERGGSGFLGY